MKQPNLGFDPAPLKIDYAIEKAVMLPVIKVFRTGMPVPKTLSHIHLQGRTRGVGGRLLPRAPILLIVASVCMSLALPTGFAGWDDLHYLQAARRWIAEGAHVPANHWATRLPYVLAIAPSLRLFGLSVFALTVPNTILFALTLLLV